MKVALNLLLSTLKSVFKLAIGPQGSKLITLIIQWVKTIEDKGMPGDEKRKEIQRQARAWLKERQLEVQDYLLNLAIEIILAYVRKGK